MKNRMTRQGLIYLLATTGAFYLSSAVASDLDIYQRAGSGSSAAMILLDTSKSMRSKYLTKDDGFGDYTDLCLSTSIGLPIGQDRKDIVVGGKTINVPYCRYSNLTITASNLFFPITKRFKSYQNFIYETCDFVGSTNWTRNDKYHCYDRFTRTQIAFIALLFGDASRGINKLSDDKVIGLSLFPAFKTDYYSQAGEVKVPARRLDAVVGTKTQRELIYDAIVEAGRVGDSKILDSDNVPLASAYADAGAYLMGTTTNAGFRETQKDTIKWRNRHIRNTYEFDQVKTLVGTLLNREEYRLVKCGSLLSPNGRWDNYGQCQAWLDIENEAIDPNYSDFYTSDDRNGLELTYDRATFIVNDDSKTLKTSGIPYANNSVLKTSNINLYQEPEIITKQVNGTSPAVCHGQGIYVVTGGLSKISDYSQGQGTIDFYIKRMMNRALTSNNTTPNYKNQFCGNGALKDYTNLLGDENNYTDNSSWSCISEYAQRLASKNNPVNLSIKTAVVGVGKQFAELEDLEGVDASNYNAMYQHLKRKTILGDNRQIHNIVNTALLGNIGGGGWYSVQSVKDIADSFNTFLNTISTNIPSASTSKTTIPVDLMNPSELKSEAYLSTYEPAVQHARQSWFGNLKKYKVLNGLIVSKNNQNIFNNQGLIRSDAQDEWQTSILNGIDGQPLNAMFQGGALNKIKLKSNTAQNYQRIMFSNRSCATSSSTVTCTTDNQLKKITKAYITEGATAQDPQRGYLLNLLGYNISNPNNIDLSILENNPELRQMGAVIHSDPILLTQTGEISLNTQGQLDTTQREDYVLFGSTQGLLHVVKASNESGASLASGEEAFVFVPNEFLENDQKKAFLDKTLSTGGVDTYLYGIDGPWSAYSEYVPTATGNKLTVGKGVEQTEGKQWVYGGLRMGGKSYYALDLADMTAPKLKFHIDPVNNKIYSANKAVQTVTGLQYMGQSWSKPLITRVNWNGESKLVMVVGGGYDGGYEAADYNQTNGVGAGIYMFDANTGDLLWWASNNVPSNQNTGDKLHAFKVNDMKHSVVSTIKAVDRDGDDLTDHFYFGDLGGRVWRIDINNFRKSGEAFAKRAVKLLDLNTANGQSPRFYVQPAFSIYRVANYGTLATLSIGSGNLSRPLHTASNWPVNKIYTLFDKDVTRADLMTNASIATSKTPNLVNLTPAVRDKTSTTPTVPNINHDGWSYTIDIVNKFSLSTNNEFYAEPLGAKVITDPVVMNKQLLVSVFDSAKSGTVQGCSAGIRGESVIERFCLPFGVCDDGTAASNRLYAGVGIVPLNISSLGSGGNNSRLVLNNQCQGDNCSILQATNKISQNHQLMQKLRPKRWFEVE